MVGRAVGVGRLLSEAVGRADGAAAGIIDGVERWVGVSASSGPTEAGTALGAPGSRGMTGTAVSQPGNTVAARTVTATATLIAVARAIGRNILDHRRPIIRHDGVGEATATESGRISRRIRSTRSSGTGAFGSAAQARSCSSIGDGAAHWGRWRITPRPPRQASPEADRGPGAAGP